MVLTLQCTVFNIILLLQGGDTALIVSARGGHYETVKLLLDNGADPNPDQEYVSIYIVYLIISFILTVCTACSSICVHLLHRWAYLPNIKII